MAYHPGQRLSLKGQLLTVRYIGHVAGKSGEWLGVEWDDAQRGKHNGEHEGTRYFQCRSTSPTCASFLRPAQPWDATRSCLEALREKYVSGKDTADHEVIYVSKSKQAEEVGFDKFAQRQAELRGIHVIVLDHMQIHGRIPSDEREQMLEMCKDVTELDIGYNLFESIGEVYELCCYFPKLRRLTLDGNRFCQLCQDQALPTSGLARVKTLSLNSTLLDWPREILSDLLEMLFSGLESLSVTHNEWTALGAGKLPDSLRSIDLSDNELESLDDLIFLEGNPQVASLVMKNNRVAAVHSDNAIKSSGPLPGLLELELRHNFVSDFGFFDQLTRIFPNLSHLRTTGNPVYMSITSAEGRALTAEDGYMLTIARMPSLQTLNYSKITEKEKMNAEVFYRNQIVAEVSRTGTDAEAAQLLKRHPRWEALCEEYGEPDIAHRRHVAAEGREGIDPNSLAARLVTLHLTRNTSASHQAMTWDMQVPKSFSIYSVLGMVGKHLECPPLQLRLVWETGESDPLARGREYTGPEVWDSSDEEDETSANVTWEKREVELVPGTRALGTYVDGMEATVRLEMR